MRATPVILSALFATAALAVEDPLALNDPLRQLIVDTDVRGVNILNQTFSNRVDTTADATRNPLGPDASALDEFLRGNDPRIIPQLEALLRKHPGNSRAWEHLGSLRFREKDYPAALEAFDRAYQLDPGRASILNNYAACNIVGGKLDRARELLFQLLTLRPDDHAARFNLACLLAKQSRNDACVRELEKLELASWKDLPLHVADSDLDSVRSHPAFIALQSRLRARERPVPIQR